MQNEIQFSSIFHGIGQGLFYSFQIDGFTLIYDCGSRYYRKHKSFLIESIIKLNLSNVDCFVISHFHLDHINGIIEFKKHNITITEFVMPFIKLYDRLLFIEKDSDIEHLQFLIDPIKYLQAKFPNATFRLIGSDNEENNSEYLTLPKQIGWENPISEELINGSRIYKHKFLTHFRNEIWLFKFYLSKNILKKTIDKYPDVFNSQLLELIKIKSYEKILKKLIRINKNQNELSIQLIHYPIIKNYGICLEKKSNFKEQLNRENDAFLSIINYPIIFFLTGDANIPVYVEKFHSTLFSVLKRIIIFQVPHHGSKKSWHKWFKSLKNCSNVLCYAKGNSYNHPSIKNANSEEFIHVTYNNSFKITGRLKLH